MEESIVRPEDIENEEEELEDDPGEKLLEELQTVIKSRDKRAVKARNIERILKSVKIEDIPELADSPIIQAFVQMFAPADLEPGETRNSGTLAEVQREWTHADFARFKFVEITPAETIPLTINGVTIQLVADEPCTIPEPFAALYRDHRLALRKAEQHKAFMLGKSDVPPDPNWANDATARVRAFTKLGAGHLGVGRLDIKAPPSEEPGVES